ncbi:MAG TPA: hypothetical protein VGL83_03180 [Stellaceae bacterium]
MPVGSVATAIPPQVSMALEALSSTLQSEQEVATALLGGGTATAGASNPGLGQMVDISA